MQKESVNNLVRVAIKSLMPESQGRDGGDSGGGSSNNLTGRNSVLNPSDFHLKDLHEKPTPDQCRRWFKELGIYLEARSGWAGAKAFLHQLRLCRMEVTSSAVFEGVLEKSSDVDGVDILDWKFSERSSILYTLTHNKLPDGLNSAIGAVDDGNGVELLRTVLKDCDPVAEGQREILIGRINAMASEECKKFKDMYEFLIRLQAKSKEMFQMTNENPPIETLRNVLYSAADDDTIRVF